MARRGMPDQRQEVEDTQEVDDRGDGQDHIALLDEFVRPISPLMLVSSASTTTLEARERRKYSSWSTTEIRAACGLVIVSIPFAQSGVAAKRLIRWLSY